MHGRPHRSQTPREIFSANGCNFGLEVAIVKGRCLVRDPSYELVVFKEYPIGIIGKWGWHDWGLEFRGN
jgi:hypothetical protein